MQHAGNITCIFVQRSDMTGAKEMAQSDKVLSIQVQGPGFKSKNSYNSARASVTHSFICGS